MNRKTILFWMVFMLSMMMYGQTSSPEFESFLQTYQAKSDNYQVHVGKKEYREALTSLGEMLKMIEEVKLSSDDQKQYGKTMEMLKANTHYNMACVYSLQNRKKQALESLPQSIKSGYQEYRHILQDSDLDNIRKERKFIALVESLKQYDKLIVLQRAAPYDHGSHDSLPEFSYQSAQDENLRQVRAFFKLDSVAGNGDEISKILRILQFVHNSIRHNGSNYSLCEFDAIDIYNYHKSTGKGVNCRHLAIALNEMYLAMGIPSRYVTCLPKDGTDPDCHVINSVYSTQLKKWIWIDPTFNAYVTDEQGNMLSIAEVRERLMTNKPLVLNDDANWNNESKQTKEHYLEEYMAKNLYWMKCVKDSRFNPESRYRDVENIYISLLPQGFEDELSDKQLNKKYVTHNPNYFWQKPVFDEKKDAEE